MHGFLFSEYDFSSQRARSSKEVTEADAFLCDLDSGLCALCVKIPWWPGDEFSAVGLPLAGRPRFSDGPDTRSGPTIFVVSGSAVGRVIPNAPSAMPPERRIGDNPPYLFFGRPGHKVRPYISPQRPSTSSISRLYRMPSGQGMKCRSIRESSQFAGVPVVLSPFSCTSGSLTCGNSS